MPLRKNANPTKSKAFIRLQRVKKVTDIREFYADVNTCARGNCDCNIPLLAAYLERLRINLAQVPKPEPGATKTQNITREVDIRRSMFFDSLKVVLPDLSLILDMS